MSHPIVELKGYRDGLRLIIDPDAPMEQVEVAIGERMANLGDSLAGTTMNIDIGSRTLSADEVNRLKKLLHDTYGLEVKRIMDESDRANGSVANRANQSVEDLMDQAADNLRIMGAPALHQEEHTINDFFSPEIEETRIIRHTLRSGQVERFLEGNIVILGDVNPGAEVTAAGDIIVLGSLRGVAHAGALGNTSSVIIALNLLPTQLRIGRFITRPPSSGQRPRRKVEIAHVKEDAIVVEEFKGL